MPSPSRGLALAALLFGLLATPAKASDPIGTAGPIRSFGGGDCKLAYAARMRGECDPPAIDATLSGELRAQARVERARQLLMIMRMEQASRELDDAIAEDPHNTAALLLRGRLKINGNLDQAAADMDRVLRIDPDNSDAHATLAFALRGRDTPRAFDEVTKALTLNPRNADARWIRAMMLAATGKLHEAEQDLTAAVAVEPDVFRVLLARARIDAMMDQMDNALRDVSAILKVQPNAEALHLRGIIRAKSGDYAGALEDFDAVLGPAGGIPIAPARPDNFDLYIQRAVVLTRVGRPADAARDLDAIVRYGGTRAVLQMQIYLRSHGFPDVSLDGERSDRFEDAIKACFINELCGRGITISG